MNSSPQRPAFPIALSTPVALAPMSGITDLPFRNAVARFGVGLLVSEMISSSELVTARPSRRAASRARAEVSDSVPTSVQLAGREAAALAEAARIAEGQGAPMIDINMGCPAKKVTGGLSGSALMREPDLALSLVDAVVAAVSVPVSVKMRLGWCDQSRNAAQVARRAEDAGVQMLAVHGRTREQFYTGHADWAAIAEVVDAVRIPVFVNGDIRDASSARDALKQSGAAGVMIGRGAQGRPWLLAQVAAALFAAPSMAEPDVRALSDIAQQHYDEILQFYGVDLGVRIARKHLGWYCDAAGGDPQIRAVLMRERDPDVVLQRLPEALHPVSEAA